MKAGCAALLAALLAACASTPPPPGTVVAADKLEQLVQPGRSTKAELLATLGPTHAITFGSGYEAWLYQSPAGPGRYNEFVVLLDPQGVVRKVRRRAADKE
jgi:hypothetical protein